MTRSATKASAPLLARARDWLRADGSASNARLELWLAPHWPESDAPIGWRLRRANGRSTSGRAAHLADLPAEAAHAQTHVWAPATEAVLLRAHLPTRSHRQIMQALPYALEEQLLDPPQELHFAYQRDADDGIVVAVAARARLRAWLDALASVGIRPRSVAPAVLGLPLESGSWTIGFTGHECLLRTGPLAGIGAPLAGDPPQTLRAALREAREQGLAPQRLLLFTPPRDLNGPQWAETLAIPIELAATDTESSALPTLNMLHGEFSARPQWRGIARPYLPAAALLLVWLTAAFVVDVVEWARLWNTQREQQHAMHALLLKSFPDTKAVLDPAKQLQRNLALLQTRGGPTLADDFLPLLTRATPSLQPNRGVHLLSLSYGERSITLNVALPSEAALATLTATLRAEHLEVEAQTTNRRGTQIEARLRVRPTVAASPRKNS